MKTYEAILIYPPQLASEALKSAKASIVETIQKQGGKLNTETDLGLRSLGHTLRKNDQGFFVFFEFVMGPDQVNNFKKWLGLSEDLLKYTVVVKEIAKVKKPKAPKKKPVSKREPAAPAKA